MVATTLKFEFEGSQLTLSLCPDMASLNVFSSSSRASLVSMYSQKSFKPASSSSGASSAGSFHTPSRTASDIDDEEDVTITSNRIAKRHSKLRSQEDLRLLAISTHMTELSYSMSDIQTRIFEIQELRHKSQISSDSAGTTNIIDQSLMNLDDKLESVSKGMKSINDSLGPLLQAAKTPTVAESGESSETAVILRKHATLVAEWEAVQEESEVLREELKEDKWLTVFRTVTDQADGMMSSLEKAVNRCQDFIWQVHRRGPLESTSSLSGQGSLRSEKSPVNMEVFNTLMESFQAKKKHYVPATSKVLSIIDKGVQDRVTKNGETLRRHAESAQRWRNLRERIARTDAEMERVRRVLTEGDTPSENGSHASAVTSSSVRNGHLVTTPSGPKGSQGTISRSMSPFRKFARRITGSKQTPVPVTPLTITKTSSQEPSSEPVPTIRRQRSSLFSFRGSQPPAPIVPDRLGHRYSHSLTPDASPREVKLEPVDSPTVKSRQQVKQLWNSSTKISTEDRALTVKATPPKRPSTAGGRSDDIPPVPPLGPQYNRSASRASSRPWSPVTSSVSTSASSPPSTSMFRPPSRAETPSQSQASPTPVPRSRPKTPSHIPAPSMSQAISGRTSEAGWYDDEKTATVPRAFSPAFSTTSATSPTSSHPPRPPSRSMIPVPSLHFSSASRPSSAMSQYANDSPSPNFKFIATRAQTPESTLRSRVQQIPFYTGGKATRTLVQKLPPSSFRDGRMPGGSRPGSRAGAYTPLLDHNPIHEYTPGNLKDPLDVEVAAVVNSIAHGLLVERVDPPLRTVPREGTEIRAQYAFSNSLSRKVVTCRLTTMTRSSTKANGNMTSKKVMCRVGGGWQDLQLYMLSRLDV